MAHPDHFHLAGLLGWPVMHTRSPMLHGYWLKKYNISGTYLPLPIPAEGLRAALRALPGLRFRGVNLTIPHKVAALAMVDHVDPVARRIGAINCITLAADGSLAGSNNDGFGYIESLVEALPNWRADRGPIVVLGAGGAARAVLVALADRGAREILLVNRSRAEADALASALDAPIRVLEWDDRHRALQGAAMLINATSQGMVGEAALDLRLDLLPRDAVVSDVVYTPLETPLLLAARARGNSVVDGLGMLLHQARPAFHAWFGVMPQVTAELRAMISRTIGG